MAVRHGPGREYRAVPPPSSLDAPIVVDDDEPASPTPSTTWCVVTAERRPQWTDLPGQYALEPRQTAGALVQQARPCTGEEIEDALLREALGAMDVDSAYLPCLQDVPQQPQPERTFPAPGLPPPLPASGQLQGEVRPSERLPRPTTATGTCPHNNVTRASSNAYFRQRRCLDCGELLEKIKIVPGEQQAVQPPPPAAPGCMHHRVSWKGTNGSVWRRTCVDCGYVETGPLGRDRSRGPTAIPTGTSSSSSTAVTHGPLHGQEETPEILLSAGEVDRALRAFNGAVQTKVETLQPNEYIRASALVESLQLTLRLTTIFEEPPGPQRQPSRLHQTSSTPTSGTAPGRRERDNELHQRLRGRASARTEGKYKNRTVYEAYLDRNYVNWIMDNINENSGRGMKQLKQVIVELSDFERRYGKLFDEDRDHRTSYMAIEDGDLASRTTMVEASVASAGVFRREAYVNWSSALSWRMAALLMGTFGVSSLQTARRPFFSAWRHSAVLALYLTSTERWHTARL